MTTYVITAEMEILFGEYLEQDEKSKNTIEKYRRDLRKFVEYIDGEEVTKELVIGFKEYLVEHYAVNSVNSIIASLNRFMQFAGWQEFRVKQLKKQRQVYCPEEKELTKQEYFELIRTAKREGKEKIGLIIQTIGSTGIRISELPSITVQAVKNGVAQVDCKGKNRQVLLPAKASGEINALYKERTHTMRTHFYNQTGESVRSEQHLERNEKNLPPGRRK